MLTRYEKHDNAVLEALDDDWYFLALCYVVEKLKNNAIKHIQAGNVESANAYTIKACFVTGIINRTSHDRQGKKESIENSIIV
jgi:hypothetical protein